MKKWQVLISESARKDLYSLENEMQKRIKKAFDALAENPFRPRSGADILKLKGSFNPVLYRIRVGDYRMIYSIFEDSVKITRILHRSKAYEWLDN